MRFDGLTMFIAMSLLNITVLGFDYMLINFGFTAITQLSVQNPYLAGFIIVAECVMPISICVHFYDSRNMIDIVRYTVSPEEEFENNI